MASFMGMPGIGTHDAPLMPSHRSSLDRSSGYRTSLERPRSSLERTNAMPSLGRKTNGQPLSPLPNMHRVPHYGHRPPKPTVEEPPAEKPSKWIHELCNEPPGDLETCCLGFWVPCALYGKTQHRLAQMAAGGDAFDMSDYKCCNTHCWIFAGVSFLGGFQWVLVMLQQSRVRATFNIEGTSGRDCGKGVFCVPCSVIQADREVRAREQRCGQEVNHIHSSITEQPPQQPEMQYRSSGLTNDVTAANEDTRHAQQDADRDPAEPRVAHILPNGLNKESKGRSPIDNSVTRKTKSSTGGRGKGTISKRNASPAGSALNPIVDSPQNKLSRLDTIIDRRQPWRHDRGRRTVDSQTFLSKPQDPLSDFPGSDKDRGNLFRKHNLGECLVVEDSNTATTTQTKPRDCQSNESTRDEAVIVYYGADHPQRRLISDCARHRSSTPGLSEQQSFGQSLADPAQHVLVEFAVENNGIPHHSDQPIQEDGLMGCDQVEGFERDGQANGTFQHALVECVIDTRATALGSSETPKSHDLKECPDDADITSYVSSQGIPEHNLNECVDDADGTTYESPSASPQHHLNECSVVVRSSITEASEAPQGHLLQECVVTADTSSDPSSPTNRDHELVDCDVIEASKDNQLKVPFQHRFDNCSRIPNGRSISVPAVESHHKAENADIISTDGTNSSSVTHALRECGVNTGTVTVEPNRELHSQNQAQNSTIEQSEESQVPPRNRNVPSGSEDNFTTSTSENADVTAAAEEHRVSSKIKRIPMPSLDHKIALEGENSDYGSEIQPLPATIDGAADQSCFSRTRHNGEGALKIGLSTAVSVPKVTVPKFNSKKTELVKISQLELGEATKTKVRR